MIHRALVTLALLTVSCTSREECAALCAKAHLVVSRANGTDCDCADPRAPAYIDNTTTVINPAPMVNTR